MESKKIATKRTSHSPLCCLVCGDVARGMNFDVITCMSCKAFFRRNATHKAKELRCLLNDDCIISLRTRAMCSACRLKKCFALGMNPALIRAHSQRSTIVSRQQSSPKSDDEPRRQLPQPTTVSLLSNDHSTLTFNEWNLLSNIIHAYDEQNVTIRAQCALREQQSLPLKVRLKKSHTLDLVGSFYTAIQPILQRSPYFNDLSSDVRRVMMRNNLSGTGAFNTLFASGEARLLESEPHIRLCNEIYGVDYMAECVRMVARLEPNGTLIKMMLMILAFSSNCSLVLPDQTSTLADTSTARSLTLVRTQDIFVVTLWKYLVYQYGFLDAVRRLDYLVRTYLNLLNRINDNNSREHRDMVQTITTQATHALTWDS